MRNTIDGLGFSDLLRAGAHQVKAREEALNRINVFPVADADTGHNLALTLTAAARAVQDPTDDALGRVVRTAAEAALDEARGNSGAIFAQFLHGFSQGTGDAPHHDPQTFSQAARAGSQAAHQAVRAPREGTILSVLTAWADALTALAAKGQDFMALWADGLGAAQAALARTPEQLAVLAEHGVVDAGGQGFVHFLEGGEDYLRQGKPPDPLPRMVFREQTGSVHADPTTKRYCANALVEVGRADRQELDALLAGLGDSLVVAGGPARYRIHLHTDGPRTAFERLAELGHIARCRIDDMRLQQHRESTKSLALVTDSTCDLPETDGDLEVYRVPLAVSLGDREYKDGTELAPAVFYQHLAESPHFPQTSQPAQGSFRRIYENLLESHRGVISVHIAEAISGTCAAARRAAAEVDPARIRVVDSRQVSVGLGLVIEALAARLKPDTPLDAAAALAAQLGTRVRLFGSTPSLAHAVRGGRVSARLAWLLDLLGVKPVIAFDGAGKPHKAAARVGFGRALDDVLARARRYGEGRPVRAMVVHAATPEAAGHFAVTAKRALGLDDLPVVQAGAVLGSHVGPGTVALAVQRLG